jgi:hypothetical protein
VIVIDESERELSLSNERIEQAITLTDAKLFILDPLQAYLGADVDMHRAKGITIGNPDAGSRAKREHTRTAQIRKNEDEITRKKEQKQGRAGIKLSLSNIF